MGINQMQLIALAFEVAVEQICEGWLFKFLGRKSFGVEFPLQCNGMSFNTF